jgi:hypothetical protein
MSDKAKIASSINLVAGLWLMASAFVMAVGFFSSPFVVGLLVAIFALIALSRVENSTWIGWMNGLLGFWLLISPLFLTMESVGSAWNSVILGLILIGSALWSMMSSPSMGHGHPSMS